jgi:hypothetical protein
VTNRISTIRRAILRAARRWRDSIGTPREERMSTALYELALWCEPAADLSTLGAVTAAVKAWVDADSTYQMSQREPAIRRAVDELFDECLEWRAA